MEYRRSLCCRNIKKVFLVITKNCNLSCPFCIREDGEKEKSNLSYEEIYEYMEQLKKMTPNAAIVITGGEATTHVNFGKIVKLATELFHRVVICSNGTNFKPIEENIEILKRCMIQISIDGNELYHDMLRGKGTYRRSRKTIEYLLTSNIRTIVASTVSRDNIGSIREMFEDMCSLGVENFKISQEMPSGFAKQRKESQLNYNEWNQFCDEFKDYSMKFNKNISLKKLFPFVGKKLNMNNVSNDMLCMAGCKAGVTQLYIYPNKMVYGCPMLIEHPIIDLNKNSLLDIEEHYIKGCLYNYAPGKQSKCLNCEYLLVCRGGCPGRSKGNDNIWEGDYQCPLHEIE
jgi:radical SAM protein with 4Fe4S-binding SPASM domain